MWLPPRALRRPGRGARPPRNGTARRLGSVSGGGPALARPAKKTPGLLSPPRHWFLGAWLRGGSGIAPAAAGAGWCPGSEPLTMAAVSMAIMSSSLVGISRTFTLESAAEITVSLPRVLLASASIFTPMNSRPEAMARR